MFNIISVNIIAQNKVDVESIFKMQLILDKEIRKDIDVLKGDSLYIEYSKSIKITPKSLAAVNIDKSYVFLSLRLFDDVVRIPSESDENNKFFEMRIHLAGTRYYTLCININNGRSYRLEGFNGNDFLNFLTDYTQNENISVKEFLKKCSVERIDFNCLYKGLKENVRNTYKYPCLKRVSDL